MDFIKTNHQPFIDSAIKLVDDIEQTLSLIVL